MFPMIANWIENFNSYDINILEQGLVHIDRLIHLYVSSNSDENSLIIGSTICELCLTMKCNMLIFV